MRSSIDETAIQPRRLAVGQQVGREIEIGVARRRTSPASATPDRAAAARHDLRAEIRRSLVERRRAPRPARPPARRDAAEVRAHQRERCVGIDVAGERQRRVRRMVVAPEEGVHFVEPSPPAGRRFRRSSSSDTDGRAETAPRASPSAPVRTGGSRSSAAARSARRRAGWRTSARSAPAADSPCDRIPSTAPARARRPARLPSSWCDRRWSIR